MKSLPRLSFDPIKRKIEFVDPFKICLFFCLIHLLFSSLRAQVCVVPATGGASICAGTYTALGDIRIQECATYDEFAPSQTNVTIILGTTSGFQFKPGEGVVSGGFPFTPPYDITAISITVTQNSITLTISTDNTGDRLDLITISGLQVRASAVSPIANPNPGIIVRTGGTAIISGLPSGGSTSLGSLTQATNYSTAASISSEVIQPSIACLSKGTNNNNIIGIKVITSAVTSACGDATVTSFTLNTTGSTNPGTDISNARIFCTGTSPTFATTSQFGSTFLNPNGTFIISGSEVLGLAAGSTYYFWLTYDIPPGATVGNLLDGECTSVTVAGVPQTPVPTMITGTRTIQNTAIGAFVVSNTNDAGVGSLRQALTNANANGVGLDVITFNICGCGGPGLPCVINLQSPLPLITGAVNINGYSHPNSVPNSNLIITSGQGLNSTLSLEINGGGNNITNCFSFETGSSGSLVQGIAMWNFGDNTPALPEATIAVNSPNVRILGCYVGMRSDGTTTSSLTGGVSTAAGIYVNNVGSNNIYIGDGTAAGANLISGENGISGGICIAGSLADGTIIRGNLIGTLKNGLSKPSLNADKCIFINGSPSTKVGGTTAGMGNLISGINVGIDLRGAIGEATTLIQGNYIGSLGPNGNTVIGGMSVGILFSSSASGATIGGASVGARNIISGSGYNIHLNGAGSNSIIQGNYIGTTADGLTARGGHGIRVDGNVSGVNVGGNTGALNNIGSPPGNVFAGGGWGINAQGGIASGWVIKGNYFGVSSNGITPAIGPQQINGIYLNESTGSSYTIGGPVPGDGNVISGNSNCGIYFTNWGNQSANIQGNYIGVDKTGLAIPAAQNYGILIKNGDVGQTYTIGGASKEARNVISGNTLMGIEVATAGAAYNINGNIIGLGADGTSVLSTVQGNGIKMLVGVSDVVIGAGTSSPGVPPGNIISGNNNYGIDLQGIGTGNVTISGNLIGPAAGGLAPTTITQDEGIRNINGPARQLNTNLVSIGSPITSPVGNEYNIIAFNSDYGVNIQSPGSAPAAIPPVFNARRNVLSRNLIHSNGVKGIYLNYGGGANFSGNNDKRIPVINCPQIGGPITGNVNAGTLGTTSGTNDVIEVYKVNGSTVPGQAFTYIGTTTATLNTWSLAYPVAAGDVFVATSRTNDPLNPNTSEFSLWAYPLVTLNSQNVSCNNGNDGLVLASVTGGSAPYTYAWSPSGGNTNTASGLNAGTYTVSVTDLSGCVIRAVTTITEPAPLLATISNINHETCPGSNNGSATATATGGTAPYTYSWNTSPVQTTSTAVNLTAGTYICTVTDNKSCVKTVSVTINVAPLDNASFSYSSSSYCKSGLNPIPSITGALGGSFSATPAGLIFVNNSSGEINLNASALNTYTITYTTAGPCVNSSSTLVTITPDANITLTSAVGTNAQSLCVNTALSTITYSISGGGASATASGLPAGVIGSFSGGVFTISGTPSTAGIFNYTVTTSGTCLQTSAKGTITVNPNAAIGLTSAIGTDAQSICLNNAITTITYSVSGGGTSATATGLPPGINGSFAGGIYTLSGTPSVEGTFNYTLTTTGTCAQTSASGTVTIYSLPTITSVTFTDESYCGANDGTLTINATGSGLSYSINGGSTFVVGNVFTGLPAGSYPVQVKNSSGCIVGGGTISVSSAGAAAAPTANATPNPLCEGSNFTLSVSNPVGGEVYNWSGPGGFSATGSSVNISNVTSSMTGQYTVTSTFGSCVSSGGSVIVTINPNSSISLTSAPGSNTQTVCNNSPISTITYAISGGGTGASVSGLPIGLSGSYSAGIFTISGSPSAVGTFNYTVTTTGTCTQTSSSGSIVINPNASIVLSSAAGTNGQIICNTIPINTITYSVSGGGTGANVSGLPSGVSGSFSGGVLTISGTPGTLGNFNYTVTTTGTCSQVSASGSIIVNPNASISLSSAVGTNAQSLCVNTSINPITYSVSGGGSNASVSGLPSGVSGSFSGGVFTINGTPNIVGTFNYTVTTSGTCAQTSASGSINVNSNAAINLTSAAGSNAQSICINTAISNITYSVSGGGTGANVAGLPQGITATFSGGVLTISGTPAVSGTFNYVVTSTGTCAQTSVSGTLTVNPNASIVLSSANGTNAQSLCLNTAITDITYSISGGGSNATVSGLPTGISGSFANGVFTISGSPTVSGTYNYTLNTTGTCIQTSATGSINVNQDAVITLTSLPGSDAQTICVNSALDPITYAVSGGGTNATVTDLPIGVTASFSGGILTITGNPAATGTFYYTATTTGTCGQTSATGSIIVSALPPSPIASNNGPVCEGTPLSLMATAVNGASYSWSGPNGFASPIKDPLVSNSATFPMAGTYSVTATAAGCTSLPATTTVGVKPTPAAPTASNNGPLCEGSILTLFTNTITGASYSWTGPLGFVSTLKDPTVSNAATVPMTGTYMVVHTVAGCSSPSSSTQVMVNVVPSVTVNSESICAGNTVTLTAIPSTSGGTYNWTPGNLSSETIVVQPMSNSIYTVLYSLNGCSNTGVSNVTVNPIPDAQFYTSKGVTIHNSTVSFYNTSLNSTAWFWNFGDGYGTNLDTISTLENPIHTYSEIGNYYVMLVAENGIGCVDTMRLLIIVEDELTLYVPNAFTPDGDNSNNEFYVQGNFITAFEMRIYDRWGTLVFYTNNINDHWNGRLNNTGADVLQQGVYTYEIIVRDKKDINQQYFGSFTLLK